MRSGMSAAILPLLFVAYTPEQVDEARQRLWSEIPPEIDKAYYKSNVSSAPGHDNRIRDIRNRSAEFRQKLIEWGRKMANPLPGYTDHGWEEELFYYRDEQMVSKFVSKWFDEGDFENYGRKLRLSENPEVVT